MIRKILFFISVLFFCSCSNQSKVNDETEKNSEPKTQMETKIESNDPHSYSKPDLCSVNHLDWELNIDFNAKQIAGVAHWTIDNKSGGNELILDAKNLDIENITLDDGMETSYNIGEYDEVFGSALKIAIRPETKVVNVKYKTTDSSSALMWMDAEKTKGKKHPFLFTQSQAILARTWIPCQDGPGVRYTYSADVKAPKDLLVCMSASNPQEKNETGMYHFEMKQPVPSYLMALVAGNLEFRSIGERTGIYAEPEMADAVEYEFGEMDEMLTKAENLYGSYRWDRYDVVVLPPSFPFGGMENPRLTFATPTVVVGDRSLTSLIAHELAHSWSGNLVTNANWNDFWLNEGFTVYFEQRIMEEVYGRDYSEMLALNSFNGLVKEIAEFEQDGHAEATHLKLNLGHEDPDDGLTSIAYDKGYMFLRMLEESYGRKKFDAFLKSYFNAHAFNVMTTEEFVSYLNKNLLNTDLEKKKMAQIEAWIYGPGLPSNCPVIKSERLAKVGKVLNTWKESMRSKSTFNPDTAGWSAHEYIYFVSKLPAEITAQQMQWLDHFFQFTDSRNAEILGQWLKHGARARYEKCYGPMEHFLVSVGRRKFLTPIYKALVSSPEGLVQAKEIYAKARPNYHTVATQTMDELFEKADMSKSITDEMTTDKTSH